MINDYKAIWNEIEARDPGAWYRAIYAEVIRDGTPFGEPEATAVAVYCRYKQYTPAEVAVAISYDDLECDSYGRVEDAKCGEEWLVLSNTEADDAFSESLDNYIEDMLHGVDAIVAQYFDADSLKCDVAESNGRGPTLSAWDGAEGECRADGETYYLYRQA